MGQDRSVSGERFCAETPEVLAASLSARRVLLWGAPGVGKSTLAAALARIWPGGTCWVLSADPGLPLFGAPGAVALAGWQGGRWVVGAVEALCTLDAGRFRLPLVGAVAQLGRRVPVGETLLVDAPGVVRGVAGAELLPALCTAAAIETLLVVEHEGRPTALAAEMAALGIDIVRVAAAPKAQRPGSAARAAERTRLWETFLASGPVQSVSLKHLTVVGMPPPRGVPEAWVGRQVALLAQGHTVAMGEVLEFDAGWLRGRWSRPVAGEVLLIRDASRDARGRLGTAPPFAPERLTVEVGVRAADVPAVVAGRVGNVDVRLLNGVFGDPLLHLRLRYRRRGLLFDLGEGVRLSARAAHEVTDVFISHAHMDHLGGFLGLMRSRIDRLPACRCYGPPGLARHIAALMGGFLWDRVGDRAPCFEVMELHGDTLRCFRVVAGRENVESLPARVGVQGRLLSEPDFQVRAVTLDHAGTPVLAFAFEPAVQCNVRKDRLRARRLQPGPWLRLLKDHFHTGTDQAWVTLPDGRRERASVLAADLIRVTPGRRLVYATDLGDTPANRAALVALARGAHTLFLEACFRTADAEQARRTGHLTTRVCGEIAAEAEVTRLVPFHFSRRYVDACQALYAEIAAVCPAVRLPAHGEPGMSAG